MLYEEIGTAAGVVWRFLEQNGPATASRIKKDVPLPPGMVDRAIGWLAREEKIEVDGKGRNVEFKTK